MFKKLIFVFSLFAAVNANAQNAVKTSGILDNTFMGIGAGVSTNLHFDPVFPVNTGATIQFGKWVNPKTGISVEDNVLFGSADYKGGRFSYKNAVRANYLGVNVINDLPNLFKQKNRKFTVISKIGAGWFHTFNNEGDGNNLAAKAGLDFTWNVSKAFNIYLEPAVYWNLTYGVDRSPMFNSKYAQAAVQVGFIYNFKNTDGTRGFTYYNIGTLNDSINEARKLAHDKEVENATLYKALKNAKTVHDTIWIEQPVQFFSKGDYTMSNDFIYSIYKAGDRVSVYGYASPEGSKKFNLKLSQKRADTIANYLRSKGIIVLESKGLGVVGKNSNRVAIVIKKQ